MDILRKRKLINVITDMNVKRQSEEGNKITLVDNNNSQQHPKILKSRYTELNKIVNVETELSLSIK